MEDGMEAATAAENLTPHDLQHRPPPERIYLEPWPGNSEFEGRVWCEDQIEPDWTEYLRADLADGKPPDFRASSYEEGRRRVIAWFERRYVEWVLERTGGNITEAARIAGCDRSTLYRKMKAHGFERHEFTSGTNGGDDG